MVSRELLFFDDEMSEATKPQFTAKEPTKAGPFTAYILPLESQTDTAQSGPNPEARPQTVTTDFAELDDGTLLELVEDPADPNRTLLAVWQNPRNREVQYVREFKDGDKTFVPWRRYSPVLKSIRLPKYALPYAFAKVIWEDLEKLISRCVDVQAKYIPVLADFIMSTWFVDRFQVAPYLSIVGLPQSGKTTLLKFLSSLCRRSLLIGDITELSFYRACSQLMPTILIDEAGTIRNSRSLRRILRTGTTRDAVSVRGDETYHAYAAKVVSWSEPPDDLALNSRCIQIPMSETTRTNLLRLNEPEVERAADTLQAQLLQYRLENYTVVCPAPVQGDEILRPRSRDLVRILSAPTFRNPQRSESLLKLVASGQAVPQEPLSPEQNAVLRALFSVIHLRDDFVSVQTGDLTRTVNYFLQLAGEGQRLQPRKVGAVLTSLGFSNRTRTNSGWVVDLKRSDAEKIHQLAECYGIQNMSEGTLMVSREDCELCRAAEERSPAPTLPDGQECTTVNLREALNR